jgi:hypothetical protein
MNWILNITSSTPVDRDPFFGELGTDLPPGSASVSVPFSGCYYRGTDYSVIFNFAVC